MKWFVILLLLFTSGITAANDALPEMSIKEIQTDIYLHKSYSQVKGFGWVSSNGLIVIKENSAFIIDTPWSEADTQKLVDWVKAQEYKLLGSVSTHSHKDRTAGIAWLNEHSIPTYATAQTNQILKNEQQTLATQTIYETTAQLADGLVEIFYPGAGHSIDNIVVWLPDTKLLFGGCFIKSLGSKNLGYAGEAHIQLWPDSIEKVRLKYAGATLVVPGHGKIGNTELLTHTQQLAEVAIRHSIKANAAQKAP